MLTFKKNLWLVGFLLCTAAVAQVPMKFNYQAVARNASGNPLTNQTIGVRIVLTDGPGGAAQYMERHNVTTNPFGVFSLQIGAGDVDLGSMNAVPWTDGNIWIKVEVDQTGGTNFTTLGFAQLLSVPYAMVAGSTLGGGSGGATTLNDLTDVTTVSPTSGQVLSWNGAQWVPITLSFTNTDNQSLSVSGTSLTISGGNTVTIPTNPPQILNLNGNTLSISGGNSVVIPTTGGGGTYSGGAGIQITGSTITNTGDLSETNELQTLTLTGNALSISNGNSITLPTGTDAQQLSVTGNTLTISNGNAVTLPSGTDAQQLSISGNTLSISNGNSITLPSTGGSTYTAGSGVSISGSNVISATDNSTTNEIQALTLTGSTLSLSNGGGSVTLPGGTGGAQALDDLTDVTTNGAMNGHVLKYDGTNWVPAPDETSGTSGASLWQANGSSIYNFNSGNVGIGCTNPTARLSVENSTGTGSLGLFKNTNTANTSNILSVENDGDGYNFYSYKTGTSEAIYLVKDNTGSGTPNIYATNNGSGNTMDIFATGTGYAGNFRGGPSSIGALYAKTTSGGFAGLFDGDAGGGGIRATATGAAYAGSFEGRVKVQYDGSNAAVPHLLIYETTTGEAARINFQNASGTSYWGISAATNGVAANAKMTFANSVAGTLMTMTGEGNIGVVTTTPTARLHVVGGNTYANTVVAIENTNSGSVTPTMTITSSSSGELLNASKTGVGYGINIQKTGTLSSSAAIYGGNAGNNGEGVRGSAFGAGGYGVYGNAAGIGSSSFTGVYGYGSGSSATDYGIYGQQGSGANDYAGYFNGNVGYTGTLLATSDARLKTNIKNFNGGLNAVMQLKATTYEYKRNGELAKMNLPEGTQIGLIAQDIEKVLPELIKETEFNYIDKKDGEAQPENTSVAYKGVNYIGMIPVLINAIQEQQAQIEALQKQIDELKK